MNTLEFIASLVDALAWPAALVVLVVILRQPITDALGQGLRRFKAGPVEFEWARTVAETKAELGQPIETQLQESARDGSFADIEALVESEPGVAIMEAYSRVEITLRERVRATTGEDPPTVGMRELVRHAVDVGAISAESARAIEGLTVLRNLAVRSPSTVTQQRAHEFLAIADATMYPLTPEPPDRPN